MKSVDNKLKSHEKKEKTVLKKKVVKETGKADETLSKVIDGPKEIKSAEKAESKAKDTAKTEHAHSKAVHHHKKHKKAKEEAVDNDIVKKARARDVKRRKGEPLAKKDTVEEAKDEDADERRGEDADLESWRALHETPEKELSKIKPKDGLPEIAPKEIVFKKSSAVVKGAVTSKDGKVGSTDEAPCDSTDAAKQAVNKADTVVKAEESDNKKISQLVKSAATEIVDKVTDASSKALEK